MDCTVKPSRPEEDDVVIWAVEICDALIRDECAVQWEILVNSARPERRSSPLAIGVRGVLTGEIVWVGRVKPLARYVR